MSVVFRLISASRIAVVMVGLCASGAYAQTALSPEQSKQLDAYLEQTAKPVPSSKATPNATVPSTVGAMPNSDVAAVATPNQIARAGVLSNNLKPDALMVLSAPPSVPAGITFGLATGQGVQPALPELAVWDREATRAIVAAFEKPDSDRTADQAATFAATPASADPAFDERATLVRTLYTVDGTDALIRHFVATEHMKLIVQEVAKHIDFSKLTETDRYRLAAIAAVAQTELEDKVLALNARIQAAALTRSEILQLIVAFDIDPQRKLTKMRLDDDGKIDRVAELDLRLAQYQIIKAYETGQ